jgi:hypothetical protein
LIEKRATETRKQKGFDRGEKKRCAKGLPEPEGWRGMRQGIGSRGPHARPLFRRAPSRFSNSGRKHASGTRIHVSDFIRWPLQLQLHATWQSFARCVHNSDFFNDSHSSYLLNRPLDTASRQLSRFATSPVQASHDPARWHEPNVHFDRDNSRPVR